MCRKADLKNLAMGFALVASGAAADIATAVPVTYHFATGAVAFGTGPAASFAAGDFVSGTFRYDAQAPATTTAPDGSVIYGGPVSSFSGLSGSVAGLNFSDPRGFTQVGNETFILPGTLEHVDILQLNADPSLASPSPHNLAGFDFGGFTLVNVRFFWIESQQTPGLIPDFLGTQNLPGALPPFAGRLALDFYPTGNLNGPLTNFVFFDDLRVSAADEPSLGAMLLTGLGLVGVAARARRKSPPRSAALRRQH